MKYLSILLLICSVANAQETDTTTLQCNCNNQTVYVRFGYKPGEDTAKTFTIRKDSAKAWMIKEWQMVAIPKEVINGNSAQLTGFDTFYTKTFKYLPATAVGFIADGSVLKRFTYPFRFPYSDMMPDDPEANFYMQRLCTKILNAQITKP